MVVPPWFEVPPQGYGGLEVIAAALVDGLVARGHEVTLFGAGTRNGTAARFVGTTPDLRHPQLNETVPALLHTARVNRLLAGGGFDVVHDHTTDGPATATARQVPTVVTVHGAVAGDLGDYLGELRDTIRLVAISRAQRISRPDLDWAATVHNALPPDALDPARRAAGGRAGPVVWLGRFTPDKGPDLAIAACRAAGLRLVLAGKCHDAGERRYLRETIRPMLADDVDLLVNPDRASTQRLLAEARCLIMPIRWDEPFGMVMIEAMALGIPVVALNRGAVPELVRDGVTGWIREVPGELADALHRVDEIDPAACVAHVRDNFCAPLMARRYERVYLEAIDRSANQAPDHTPDHPPTAARPGRRRRPADVRLQPQPVLRRPDRRMPHVR
jgi:glycosyltransferase involved in cell wall biosynthesis